MLKICILDRCVSVCLSPSLKTKFVIILAISTCRLFNWWSLNEIGYVICNEILRCTWIYQPHLKMWAPPLSKIVASSKCFYVILMRITSQESSLWSVWCRGDYRVCWGGWKPINSIGDLKHISRQNLFCLAVSSNFQWPDLCQSTVYEIQVWTNSMLNGQLAVAWFEMKQRAVHQPVQIRYFRKWKHCWEELLRQVL